MNIVTITAREADRRLATVVNRVIYGDARIVLTRHGKAIAAVIPMADFEKLAVQTSVRIGIDELDVVRKAAVTQNTGGL